MTKTEHELLGAYLDWIGERPGPVHQDWLKRLREAHDAAEPKRPQEECPYDLGSRR